MQVLLGVGASLSRVRRLMEAQRLERGGLTKRKRKKKRKLNIYRVREMPIGRLNTQPLCYHSSNSRTKKVRAEWGTEAMVQTSHLCKAGGDVCCLQLRREQQP